MVEEEESIGASHNGSGPPHRSLPPVGAQHDPAPFVVQGRYPGQQPPYGNYGGGMGGGPYGGGAFGGMGGMGRGDGHRGLRFPVQVLRQGVSLPTIST